MPLSTNVIINDFINFVEGNRINFSILFLFVLSSSFQKSHRWSLIFYLKYLISFCRFRTMNMIWKWNMIIFIYNRHFFFGNICIILNKTLRMHSYLVIVKLTFRTSLYLTYEHLNNFKSIPNKFSVVIFVFFMCNMN
jgi:hypothetical protein